MSDETGNTPTEPAAATAVAVSEPRPVDLFAGDLADDGGPNPDSDRARGMGAVPEQPAGPAPRWFRRSRTPVPPSRLAAVAESVAVAVRHVVAPVPLTFGTLGRAWRVLVETVADELEGRDRLWALEAGAGRRTLFDLPEDAFIVGVDTDATALEANLRLDERVVSDLAAYQPWASGFDLVTCWYVLDGMADPAPVLDRFIAWTATGGLIVLGLPNPRSLRGWWSRITRRSPMRRSLTPEALRRRFTTAGFTPVVQAFFEDAKHANTRRSFGLTGRRWKFVQALVRICSFGLLDAARTDYLVAFRRER
jgi:hypothetical protein